MLRRETREAKIQEWIAKGARVNEALKYDVAIAIGNPKDGKNFALCLGVMHLTPEQNGGNHNVFIDIVDRNGQQIRGTYVIDWDWKDRRQNEPKPNPVILDKPIDEAGGNLAMFGGQVVRVQVKDTDSDVVSGMHTYHPDEASGNTIGHHSYYVAFQLTSSPITPPPPPPPPPPPDPPPDNPIPPPNPLPGEELQQVFSALGDIIVILGQMRDLIQEVLDAQNVSGSSASNTG